MMSGDNDSDFAKGYNSGVEQGMVNALKIMVDIYNEEHINGLSEAIDRVAHNTGRNVIHKDKIEIEIPGE